MEDSHLLSRSIGGGAIALTAQGMTFCLQLLSIGVLARILTPRDFGLIAMVATVTGFLSLFKDMGLSAATIQRTEISRDQVSTLFWINVAASTIIVGIMGVLAPGIAWFYGDPRLTYVTWAMASTFLLGGLAVQHRALLRRQMCFGRLAVVDVGSLLAGTVVGIVSASYGARHWALVLMNVASASAAAVGAWMACDWRPGRPRRGSGVRKMLTFGGYLVGFDLLNFFVRQLDNILVGWRFGPETLGIYSRAYSLLSLPLSQVVAPLSLVAVPTFSRLQNDPVRLRSYYRRGLTVVCTITMPIVAFLLVTADKVVRIVLGEQWMGAVPIFRVLGIAAFIGTVGAAGSGWISIALGNVRRRFLSYLGLAIPLTFGFWIGLHWGPIGVATALSICVGLWQIPHTMICLWRTPLGLGDFFAGVWRPALASIVAGGLLLFVHRPLVSDERVLAAILVDSVVYGSCYLVSWIFLPGGMSALDDTFMLAKSVKQSTR